MLAKNKLLVKLVISILMISLFMTVTPYVTKVFADGDSGDDILGEIQGDITKFKEAADSAGGDYDPAEINKRFVGLAQILTMIGAGVMVAVTTYMGIKYLTAGPEAQAKLKTQLIGVLVSGIVIFGAYFIWKIVINIASTF